MLSQDLKEVLSVNHCHDLRVAEHGDCSIGVGVCGCHDVRSGSFFAMPPFTRALCGAVKA